jgi:hypothetical protein
MDSYRLSRMAETDLLGIATYTLNTWGQEQTSVILTAWKRVAGSSQTNRSWAARAIKSCLVCAAWSMAAMYCFTELRRKA